jgi:hypothetical protein
VTFCRYCGRPIAERRALGESWWFHLATGLVSCGEAALVAQPEPSGARLQVERPRRPGPERPA